MAVGIVDRQKLVNIADAVRAKKGITGEMTLDAIASNISSIPTSKNNANFDFAGSGSSGDLLSYLTTVDLSGWDTSNVTDMGNMFNGCSLLTSLDVSNFDTSNVTNMGQMFGGCSSLTSLDVSNFNTSKVDSYYSFASMFYGCSSLKTLDLSNFDFSNTYNTEYTGLNNFLSDCSSLKTVTFPSTVTFKKSGISFNAMFNNCSSLTSLDLSGFDTSNVKYMRQMFGGCSSLTSLDLSNWNTSNVTDMEYMFYGCSSLTSLDLSNWNTSNVTDMGQMFYNCNKLKTLNLSSWNTTNVTNMSSMFYDCLKLTNLTLGTDWASNSSISSFSLSSCPLTHESAVDVINKLATRNNSPVIEFSNQVGLYQSEIDVATNKGWSVSGCTVLVDA